MMNPCQCGCGNLAPLARLNDKTKGWVKGMPLKFIKGHSMRMACAIRSARSVGNKYLSTEGYVLVTLGNKKRQYEHIIIAEQRIGRPLKNFGIGNPNNEIVHHINRDKLDNRPENLLVCTHEYHTALHHRLEGSTEWPEFAKVQRNKSRSH